jgi:hypothetical protein
MIAILGSLLEENDVDSRRPAREFRILGEYTDMEIGRVGIYSTVSNSFYGYWKLKVTSAVDCGVDVDGAASSNVADGSIGWTADV